MNEEAKLALQIIETTGSNLFLTGKAGNRKDHFPARTEALHVKTKRGARTYRHCCHQC